MDASPTPAELDALIREHGSWQGGLMPALHALQQAAGFIDARYIPTLADTFNVSAAEVHGVITFYKDFRTQPPAGPVVQVCRAEACQSRGADAVVDRARELVRAGAGVELDEAFCLGNCSLGPTVAFAGRMHANVDVPRLEQLLREATALSGLDADTEPVVSSTGITVFVPGDSAARSLGSDAVAAALAAAPGAQVVRTGSRGMLWLEPMIEVDSPAGRVAYGPVTPADVDGLLDAGLLTAGAGSHPLHLGPVDELPWIRAQQRVTFARVGVVDPRSADDYVAHGGLSGLRAALAMEPSAVVDAVTRSGLRGRGGAAFPTGVKWATVAGAAGPKKYVVCNGDEGDSGTFADRMLLEGDPFTLIEGMIITGYAVGADEGFIYLRSEYPDAIATARAAIAEAEERGWLGRSVLGTGTTFILHLRVGAGAYICGEETAMLESLEGRRGVVRAKPPLPALEGLFGRPTVVNNLLTLATVPAILTDGPDAYAALGTGRSRGTQVFQLAGNIARGGIVETAFGITLGELVQGLGGGTATGRPVTAVQVGGPLGAYLPPSRFDLPLDYEAFAAAEAMVGHGGVVVFDDTVDMAHQARFAMEFCAHESCGKCTPCRIGSIRGVEVIDRIIAGTDREANLDVLMDLCEVMADGSLCAMGGLTPMPVRSALTHFSEHFDRPEGAQP